MAPEPVQVPPVPTITTNGSPDRPGSLATAAPIAPTSITSPRRSVSPANLPPLPAPYIPKTLAESLLGARRSMSPNPRVGGNVETDEGTSQNPAAVLKSQASGMSKLNDAPMSPTTPAHGPKLAPIETGNASRMSSSIPSGPTSAIDTLTSPRSATSAVSGESGITATAGIGADISPTRPRLGSISETLGPGFTGGGTPGQFSPIATMGEGRGSGSSFDHRGSSISSTGGTRGKHECPNCHQTFTRHHNLKSHLLTHSHEKPFQCLTCSSRFRRLHDLKRHQKLHTGERPHVCISCGRRFARGDALARHLRGEGGCAGRRTSMGGIPEGSYDDSMEGLEHTGDMDEEMQDYDGSPGSSAARRTASLPASRSRHSYSRARAAAQRSQQAQNLQPAAPPPRNVSHHTYPPLSTAGPPGFAAPAPPGPKTYSQGGTTSHSSSGTTNSMTSTAPSTILQHGLTDSPRALSPSNPNFSIPPHDSTSLGPPARSPSYASAFHQQALENNRRRSTQGGSNVSGGYSLPQPTTSPRGHNPPLAAPLSRPGSFSSGHLAPPDAITSSQSNIFTSGEQGIWAYIKELEKRFRELEERHQALEMKVVAMTAERHTAPTPAIAPPIMPKDP